VERDAAVPLNLRPAATTTMHEIEAAAQCPHFWQTITLLPDVAALEQ